jgi:hypothetical protein
MNVLVVEIADWSVKRLVATSFAIIDIFSNHFPVLQFENLLSEDVIGME